MGAGQILLKRLVNLKHPLPSRPGISATFGFLHQQTGRFQLNSSIPYFLACYACQLGRLQDAQDWLEHALGIAAETGDEKQLKLRAVDDPDLQPL